MTLYIMLLASLLSQTDVLDPPTMMWARTYFEGETYSSFRDVHETSDGNFVAAVTSSIDPQFSICLFDATGDTLWTGSTGLYAESGRWVEELSDGSFVVTGTGRETSSSESGLLLAKYGLNGDPVWARIYSLNEMSEYGYCVVPLPDGGFLVTGRVYGSSLLIGQAWILRTDASGDTLWTDIWGEYIANYARRAYVVDDSLKVLTYGRVHADSSRGPHILTYDMDGILAREVHIPELGGDECHDMCFSPADDCFTLITSYHPDVAHVDDLGNLLWLVDVPGYGEDYGVSINTTMDGGYISGGYNTPDPDAPWQEVSGMIVKYSSSGGVQWGDYVYEEDCYEINSVRQLSQGGYIAAGRSWSFEQDSRGLLIRYAPETGIAEGGVLPVSVLLHQPSPNPFTSTLSVSYSLPETMQISLSVYDLSGRRVGELENGILETGEHTSVWDPEELPSGCYVIRLVTEQGVVTQNCVFIR